VNDRAISVSEMARRPERAAALVGAVLLLVYILTGAPTLTFWDASEFATAIGTFGIPHPPGTPLYVALGTALWRVVPALTPVQIGTLLSGLSTSAACALATWVAARAGGNSTPAAVAGLCAGAMGTVWMNATETEVYAVALFAVAAQCALAWRAYAENNDRARIALVFVAALAVPVHLSALVATPAALLLANSTPDGGVRWRSLLTSGVLVVATALLSIGAWTLALACVAGVALDSRLRDKTCQWLLPASLVTVLAWSAALIMLVRARHSPFLNQGDPDTLPKLLNVIARTQYDVAAPWPRRAPFWLQLGNIVQYADWQVALSLWNDVTPSWVRTPFSAIAAVLGAVGAVAHWRTHRVTARAAVALMLLATVGVCVMLNLRAGPSYGFGFLHEGAIREARERDYFFALAFWVWGLWIGLGAWALVRRARRAALLASLVPVAMFASSWRAISRDVVPEKLVATAMADEFLAESPRGAMLFTAGDNDSYPLWYRQAVDTVRPDVQVVVTSLLPANWYLRESLWRSDASESDTLGRADAIGRAGALARRQLDLRRPVAVSILLPASERTELGRIAGVSCWRRFGLIDVATRHAICPPRIDLERTVQSSRRLSPVNTRQVRTSIDGMAGAFQKLARCSGAAATSALRGGAVADSGLRRLLDITCNLQ
jgi:Protein of unknown function (DUF2723)